jgi:NADH dehydrogenase [ubiquinone] 1 alpha subcomplex assembly factor 1
MASRLAGYFRRSLDLLKQQASQALSFKPPHPMEKMLIDFRDEQQLQQVVVGCDADIGGHSEAYWGATDGHAIFYGNISLEKGDYDNSGYAGFRTKTLYGLIQQRTWDVSLFRYLELRAKGDQRRWMVNIQTSGLYPNVIWQHRLQFTRPGEWETIRIPFRDFVRTSYGFVQKKQPKMNTSAIETIGMSVLRQSGEFQVEIDYIKAVNSKHTLGDLDILADDEYIDKDGNLQKGLAPREKIKWF